MTQKQLECWTASVQDVDERISDYLKSRGWDRVLPDLNHDNDGIEAFYSHIMYILMRFLENEKRELFIKLPIQELANLDEEIEDVLQLSRWEKLLGTVMGCLVLSTHDAQQNMVYVTDGQYRDRDRFFCYDINPFACEYYARNDSFIQIGGNGRNVTARFRGAQLKFKLQLGNNFRVNITNAQMDFLSYNHENNRDNKEYPEIQYKSASLVSSNSEYDNSNLGIAYQSEYIQTPVRKLNKNQATGRDATEIIVVVGDRYYSNCAQAYRNTDARKIIYIGTELPYADVPTYAFTYRELYRYLCPEGAYYHDPDITVVDFPWLMEKEVELKNLLQRLSQQDASLTDRRQRDLVYSILGRFLDSNFSSETLNDLRTRYDEEWLYEQMSDECEVETFDSLLDWYNQLSFDGTNPKQAWLDAQKGDLVIRRGESYKNRCKNLRGYNNVILVESLTVSEFDDRYNYIHRYHLAPLTRTIFYRKYEDWALRRLNNELEKEHEVYNSELRTLWNTSVAIDEVPVETPVQEGQISTIFDLISREEYEHIEKDWYEWYSNHSNRRNSYQVIIDHDVVELDGDILLVEGGTYTQINIRDLSKELREEQREIIYYQKPECFSDLVRIYCDCDVFAFSSLWKNAYKQYIDDRRNNPLNNIYRQITAATKIPKSVLKKYYTQENDDTPFFMTDRSLWALCNFLSQNGYLTDTDYKDVMYGQTIVGKSRPIGVYLKRELFHLIMGEPLETDLIGKLIASGRYTQELLVQMCTRRGIATNVNLIVNDNG